MKAYWDVALFQAITCNAAVTDSLQTPALTSCGFTGLHIQIFQVFSYL